jgi:hypothetical protein
MPRLVLSFAVLIGLTVPLPAVTTTRSCAATVTVGSFRLRVKQSVSTDPLPIRRVNVIPAGAKFLYEPLQLPADLKKSGKLTLVLVPADAEQRAAAGATVLEPRPADGATEWSAPYRVGTVLLVFGPQGLDEKRVTNLVTRDEDLMADLARYARQTVELEDTIEALTLLEQEEETEDPSRQLTRGTPVEQALMTLTRAMNPSAAFYNPLGPGQRVGPQTRMGWATATFFDNSMGLFPGSGALGMARSWLMPDSEFRTAYAESAEKDGLTLCTQKQFTRSRNRQVYLWGYSPIDAAPPKLAIGVTNTIPAGTRATISFKVDPSLDWNLVDHVHEWKLTAGGKSTPVRLRALTRGWVELDLRKLTLDPGSYQLQGLWDWERVAVDGVLKLAALGNLKQARLTPDSQLRLVEGQGLLPVELEGTDFQFVESVRLKRAGRLGATNTDLEFRLPQGWRGGLQERLELEVDTSRFRAGDYLLNVQQTGGSTADVPVRILPPPPRIDNLPLLVNTGESRQRVVLKGARLDRLESLEAEGAKIELEPGSLATERVAFVTLAQAAPKAALAAQMRISGLAAQLPLPLAFQVAGPRPRIVSSAASLAEKPGVAAKDGELPAGAPVGFTLKIENAGDSVSLNASCAEPARLIQALTLKQGERRAGAKFDSLGGGTYFASFDPGDIGQSGCTLTAFVTAENGASAPATLGRVVRLPRIDSLAWTDEKLPNGYAAILTGADLETIERAGWDSSNGLPVTAAPRAGTGDQQTLKIALPWPPPSPLAPLMIWLRGERDGRPARISR